MKLFTVDGVENKQAPNPAYPKRIFFILVFEFFECFIYYGMRAILVLYTTNKLFFSEDDATLLFHTTTALVYFMCTLGAILSDVWMGRFKTMVLMAIVYTIGNSIMTVGAIPTINISAEISMYIGLLLMAIGFGGIQPCVTAFGGDQFKLPEQEAHMATFFSIHFFVGGIGIVFSTFVLPILHADVHCFGSSDCYSLAFGVPAVSMIVAIVIFVCGKKSYTMRPTSSDNMAVQVFECITTAISCRRQRIASSPRKHWLDYATEKCGAKMVNDTKVLLRILILYLPLPFFWTLFDQLGSRWVFQATRMNGDIGYYDIKPDQIQALTPFASLIIIPLCESVFYPLLAKVGISRPLQKITCGGILVSIAFIISALVEFQLEKTYPVLPGAGEAQLRLFNGWPCDYNAISPQAENFTLKALQAFEQKHIAIDGETKITYTLNLISGLSNECPKIIDGEIVLSEAKATSVFVGYNLTTAFYDDPDKSRTGKPRVRFLLKTKTPSEIILHSDLMTYKTNGNIHELMEVQSGSYNVLINYVPIENIDFKQGGVYTIIGYENSTNGKIDIQKIEIAAPNSLSMLWLIPQYTVITLALVTFCVTGITFSYAQAPNSMKSILQACWQLTIGLGNAILLIFVKLKFFESQAYEFLLFAGLMFVDMIIFMILARNYKSNENIN